LATDTKIANTMPVSLRGVPKGLICRSRDVREFMGWAVETWDLWKEAGLKVIDQVATKAELIDTDELIAFLNSKPKLSKRPNIKMRKAVAK